MSNTEVNGHLRLRFTALQRHLCITICNFSGFKCQPDVGPVSSSSAICNFAIFFGLNGKKKFSYVAFLEPELVAVPDLFRGRPKGQKIPDPGAVSEAIGTPSLMDVQTLSGSAS